MNKIIRILSLTAIVAALVGCEKDPLDKQPQSSLSPEAFFSQVSGLEAFSNNFYTTFPTVFAENADVYAMATMPEEISGRVQVPSTGGGWSWGTLRNINTLLGYLHYCKDQDAVKYYDALCRFFRAYFYFDKVKQFGDVPWYDRELGSADPELYKPRDSREYVMQKMLEDIDIAIANLPSERNVYRITKWTAMALKSRFCLFEGTFRKYHDITAYENGADYYLELAAEISHKFITTSGYSIAKDASDPEMNYRKLFSTMNATNTEVILAKDFNAALDLVHNVGGAFNTATNGRYGMTKKAVAAYLMKDGSRFTDKAGWETMSFMDEVKDRDPRLEQSIITPAYIRDEETVTSPQNMANTTTGYAPIKYLTTAAYNAYNKAEIDLILFRSAEVYLNYAEAKAELGTLTQDDLDMSVNKLRERVGMPAMNMAEANAKPDPFLKAPASGENTWGGFSKVATGGNEGVILEIRRERMVELIQEGHRYYDIIRWAEGKIFESPLYGIYVPQPENGKVIFDFNGDGTNDYCVYQTDKPSDKVTVYQKAQADVILSKESYGYIQMHKGMGKWDEERDYLKPIPSEERSLNRNLTQNPGWKDGLDF
ncbi:MAG: RagB/SusD family nutrient uptake outer membrane protein [Bacteroidales bacterium]|nr:RagB/SusD family nutrient uptake outer membrane protein [Bacteroidales bacterium]